MNIDQDKLYAEMKPLERVKANFKEKSMLYKFYKWLNRKKHGFKGKKSYVLGLMLSY